MQKIKRFADSFFLKIQIFLFSATSFVTAAAVPVFAQSSRSQLQVSEGALGFEVPTFADLITFIIRAAFVLAGVMSLIYLLLGAVAWITSGGDKEKVEKARDKIQAALVGIILVVVVVALIATFEQVVFNRALCLGLTCPATIPSLLQPR